ncbi:hypothetical protein CCACVL1_05896 [Corchorus capsularis]|uniref:Uncharacterized protein n=1 Tax=Corchorus capsularis TaxID=210143 RepID=A0A1R3JIH4_COCAP|nr:hypothetical protein CCACVL1_05896 [Corchorus capsularis]
MEMAYHGLEEHIGVNGDHEDVIDASLEEHGDGGTSDRPSLGEAAQHRPQDRPRDMDMSGHHRPRDMDMAGYNRPNDLAMPGHNRPRDPLSMPLGPITRARAKRSSLISDAPKAYHGGNDVSKAYHGLEDRYREQGKDVQGLQGSMKMHGDHGDIDNHVPSTKKMPFDPLKMLISPMTRARAKRFKDALMGLVRTHLDNMKTIQVQLKSFDDDLSKKTPTNYNFITLLAIDSRWPD